MVLKLQNWKESLILKEGHTWNVYIILVVFVTGIMRRQRNASTLGMRRTAWRQRKVRKDYHRRAENGRSIGQDNGRAG